MATFTVPPAIRSTAVILVLPSSGVTIPAQAKTASVSFTMPVDAERASTSAHMDFGIELSTNAGASWKAYTMAGWQGGTGHIGKNSTVVNPPPSLVLGGDFFQAFGGQLCRLSAKLTDPMTVGVTVTVL